MAELKDDIGVLELKIGQLKVQYDQYFTKQIKLEPLRLREEVERIILFHTNKLINSSALKFRFTSAVAKYNSYKQYWTRTVKAMEKGTYTGGRSETGAFSGTSLGNAPASANPQPTPAERAQARMAEQPRPVAAPAANDPIKEIYKNYIEAKRQCNEPVDTISYDNFAKTIQQSTQKAKETYKTDNIDLKVTIKDGKAKLTIAPKAK